MLLTTRHRTLRSWTTGVAALVLCSHALLATVDRPPVSFQKATRPLSLVELRTAPAVDVARLEAEDAAAEASGRSVPTRFAAPLAVALDHRTAGTWEELPDGSRLWRLRIASPGALSLNLTFDRYALPDGARLWIYAPDGRLVHGAFGPEDAKAQGQLWTPVVLGDELVVELHVPASAAFEPELRIGSIQHGYRFFGSDPTKQGSCNNDVVCPEGDPYRDQIRSVAVYSLNGFLVCTGQMVTNTAQDFRPYFLTADHCGVNPGNDQSVVVYWNYESPTCGALAGGSLDQNQMGATWRAGYESSDFSLLELDQMPSPAWNVYWAGWDASGAVPAASVAIHHPGVEEKAISFNDDPLTTVDVGLGPGFWEVDNWEDGTTESGSSGSCLFDATSKLCVGTLLGGFAACGNSFEDYYGKLSEGWNGGGMTTSRLRSWLDPGDTGAMIMVGGEPGGGGTGCTPSDTTMCLRNGRFAVEVDWRDFQGGTGQARVSTADLPGDDSGLFYFFDETNIEMIVKVLDACNLAGFGNYWVFFAATTNVEFTVTVTDTVADASEQWFNDLGHPADAVTDTNAFATCP